MSESWTLVTGANGFIGARLVRQLVQSGKKVKAFVRAGADLRELVDLPQDRLRIAVGDVRIEDRVFAALSSCDQLYHVASSFSHDERSGAAETRDVAVGGTRATLLAAQRAGIDKVVVTCSIASLGVTDQPEEMNEEHAFNLSAPNNYAAAKKQAEDVVIEMARAGLPVVMVNPGLAIGPGDWKPTPNGRRLLQYLGYSPSFRIPILPGGFSFVDVDDVAAGHMLAMKHGRVGERYILGGENLSVREFYALLCDVTGLAEPGKDVGPARARSLALFSEMAAVWSGQEPFVTRKLVADYYGKYLFVSSDKARRELGYTPHPVRGALVGAIRWYLDNGYLADKPARRIRLLERHP